MLHTHDSHKTAQEPTQRFHYYGAAVFLSVLFVFLQVFQNELIYQRNLIGNGQIWRLWTGNLVHTNAWHLILNLVGFWLLLLLSHTWLNTQKLLLSIAFLGGCVGLGLWLLSPDIIWYAGFSGVLYGLFMLSGLHCLLTREWLPALIILPGICGKTVLDWSQGGAGLSANLIDAPVIYAAHIYGMTGAFLLAIVFFHSLMLKQ
jgi:rhomboid family GlyGly-CTERM serine protease